MDNYLILIKAGGGVAKISCDYSIPLDFLYETIGCDTIDIVPAHYINELKKRDYALVLDDNGKIKSKPVNVLASSIYAPLQDFVVGDVLLGRRERTSTEEPDVYPFSSGEADEIIGEFNWIISAGDSE